MSFGDVCMETLEFLGLEVIPVMDSFACYYDSQNDVIGMNIEDAISLEKEWYENASQYLSNAEDFSLALWSLLHEYGHCQDTMETWKDDEDAFYREIMQMMPLGSYEQTMAYFNLPSERVATQWAANFIRENEEKCRIADEILMDFIDKTAIS